MTEEYQYEKLQKIITDYLKEYFKHFDESKSLKCNDLSKWKDIAVLCGNKNPKNISKAMDLVSYPHDYVSGKQGSSSYTLNYKNL